MEEEGCCGVSVNMWRAVGGAGCRCTDARYGRTDPIGARTQAKLAAIRQRGGDTVV